MLLAVSQVHWFAISGCDFACVWPVVILPVFGLSLFAFDFAYFVYFAVRPSVPIAGFHFFAGVVAVVTGASERAQEERAYWDSLDQQTHSSRGIKV